MSKPIFIIRVPLDIDLDVLEMYANRVSRSPIGEDYHVLVMRDAYTGGEIKFECFNSPHTEMEFQELQKRVLSLIEREEDGVLFLEKRQNTEL